VCIILTLSISQIAKGRKLPMRDFTWNYFSMTGDVDAYLLYKEISADELEEIDPQHDILQEWDEE
jgi:hypothetical protein